MSTTDTPTRPSNVPFIERWRDYDDDTRLKLAGTPERLAELDALAADLPDDRNGAIKGARRKLKRAVARMNRAKAAYEDIQAERNSIMVEEALLGAQQAKIAEEAGVTAMIVSFALGTSSRSTWSRAGRAAANRAAAAREAAESSVAS